MRTDLDAMGPWGDQLGRGDADELEDDAAVIQRYRSVFISDLHLGTPGCQAGALLDFLKAHPSDYLYLVGDIVDGWQLRRNWYWPQTHNDVVQKLLRRGRKGCRIVYVPGNHDEFARGFIGHQFGGIEVVEDAMHTTADGLQLWVTHGDHFDGVIQVKKALNYVTDFEVAVAHEAQRRGHQGVVCGHIHRAEMRTINGILYCNDGDWVESRTALVEHFDGRLELVKWAPPTKARRPMSRKIQAAPEMAS